MATPDFRLSAADKELLRLLGELLAGQCDVPRGNLPVGAAVLSDSDANRLLELIDAYVNSPDFFRGSNFVQEVTTSGGPTPNACESYLSLRKERGRSRVMSSYHWSEYLVRLGVSRNRHPHSRATPMTDGLFLRKERDLLLAAGVSDAVAQLATRILAKHLPLQRDGLRQLTPLRADELRAAIIEPFTRTRLATGTIPTTKLVAAMSLVADISVLFTTRDWNVVGTMSAVAGYGVALTAE